MKCYLHYGTPCGSIAWYEYGIVLVVRTALAAHAVVGRDHDIAKSDGVAKHCLSTVGRLAPASPRWIEGRITFTVKNNPPMKPDTLQ